MSLLAAASFMAAIFSAFLGLLGGIKARGLQPDSSGPIREIVETMEPLISGEKRFLGEMLTEVRKSGGLPAAWSSSQLVALEIAERSAKAAHERLTRWKALDTSAQTTQAASARLLMCLGAFFAALSAALQVLSAALAAA